jgi:hypothetical protein
MYIKYSKIRISFIIIFACVANEFFYLRVWRVAERMNDPHTNFGRSNNFPRSNIMCFTGEVV